MLGEVPVEAVDREVELAVGKPPDMEIILGERPVSGLRRRRVPGQPFRLVEPETIRIGAREILQFVELALVDASVEPFGDRMHCLAHLLLPRCPLQNASRLREMRPVHHLTCDG